LLKSVSAAANTVYYNRHNGSKDFGGRPPLEPGHKLTMIRLSERIVDRIDAVMGKKNQRSTFIRNAIERELQRYEKKRWKQALGRFTRT
jgi:hypothetical protein